MPGATVEEQPRLRHKVFTYRGALEWMGHRTGLLRSQGKSPLWVSSPPEFKGEADAWSPEDLFIGAAAICLMTTFAAYCAQRGIRLIGYHCETEGTLEFAGEKYRFTRMVLRPKILVSSEEARPLAESAIQLAHANCIIVNSVRCDVLLQPSIEVVP